MTRIEGGDHILAVRSALLCRATNRAILPVKNTRQGIEWPLNRNGRKETGADLPDINANAPWTSCSQQKIYRKRMQITRYSCELSIGETKKKRSGREKFNMSHHSREVPAVNDGMKGHLAERPEVARAAKGGI